MSDDAPKELRIPMDGVMAALWAERRSFSRWEALLDLVASGSKTWGQQRVGGSVYQVPKGGVVASVRYLGERWGWSKSKAERFLAMLEKEGVLGQVRGRRVRVIVLMQRDTQMDSGGAA